jgi:predicted transcriptional regulator
VEYRFPLNIPFEDLGLNSLNIMLEVGAQGGLEAPDAEGITHYHSALMLPDDVPSSKITDGQTDLTFWVGGVETCTVPVEEYSRYARGGRYTPIWWRGSAYGKLVSIWIGPDGTLIDNQKVSPVTLDQVLDHNRLTRDRLLKNSLSSSDYLSFRIGIKPDAKHISGFNVFGKGFGNHPVDVMARFY